MTSLHPRPRGLAAERAARAAALASLREQAATRDARLAIEAAAGPPQKAPSRPQPAAAPPRTRATARVPESGVSRPSQREKAVEAYLDAQVRKAGGITFKIAPVVKGLPDRCVMIGHGAIYLVEVKRPLGGELSPAQKLWHQRARGIGHRIHVLNTPELVDKFIKWAIHEAATAKGARRRPSEEIKAAAEYERDLRCAFDEDVA